MSKLLTPEIVIFGAALIALFVIGVVIMIVNLSDPEADEAKDTSDTASFFVEPHPPVALADSRVLV